MPKPRQTPTPEEPQLEVRCGEGHTIFVGPFDEVLAGVHLCGCNWECMRCEAGETEPEDFSLHRCAYKKVVPHNHLKPGEVEEAIAQSEELLRSCEEDKAPPPEALPPDKKDSALRDFLEKSAPKERQCAICGKTFTGTRMVCSDECHWGLQTRAAYNRSLRAIDYVSPGPVAGTFYADYAARERVEAQCPHEGCERSGKVPRGSIYCCEDHPLQGQKSACPLPEVWLPAPTPGPPAKAAIPEAISELAGMVDNVGELPFEYQALTDVRQLVGIWRWRAEKHHPEAAPAYKVCADELERLLDPHDPKDETGRS